MAFDRIWVKKNIKEIFFSWKIWLEKYTTRVSADMMPDVTLYLCVKSVALSSRELGVRMLNSLNCGCSTWWEVSAWAMATCLTFWHFGEYHHTYSSCLLRLQSCSIRSSTELYCGTVTTFQTWKFLLVSLSKPTAILASRRVEVVSYESWVSHGDQIRSTTTEIFRVSVNHK